MSDDHIGVKVNGVLYVKLEDARKLREGWDEADKRIAELEAALAAARREGMEAELSSFEQGSVAMQVVIENAIKNAAQKELERLMLLRPNPTAAIRAAAKEGKP